MNKFTSIAVIILAAGRGTRMYSTLPKVLFTINKKPILAISLEKLDKLRLGQNLIVVGYRKELVQRKIRIKTGKRYQYIDQKELLGTGHAVLQALPHLSPQIQTVMVINGDDSAFYKTKTLKDIINQHINSKAKMTIVTANLKRADVYGRVVRDDTGRITNIKPDRDGSEIVCGLYLFDRLWLEEYLPKLEKSDSGEYLLPRLIFTALENGALNSVKLADPKEWRSIDTPKELIDARKLWGDLYGPI